MTHYDAIMAEREAWAALARASDVAVLLAEAPLLGELAATRAAIYRERWNSASETVATVAAGEANR